MRKSAKWMRTRPCRSGARIRGCTTTPVIPAATKASSTVESAIEPVGRPGRRCDNATRTVVVPGLRLHRPTIEHSSVSTSSRQTSGRFGSGPRKPDSNTIENSRGSTVAATSSSVRARPVNRTPSASVVTDWPSGTWRVRWTWSANSWELASPALNDLVVFGTVTLVVRESHPDVESNPCRMAAVSRDKTDCGPPRFRTAACQACSMMVRVLTVRRKVDAVEEPVPFPRVESMLDG